LERAAVSGFIATDPFLMNHCSPILFDNEHPASGPVSMPYLDMWCVVQPIAMSSFFLT